MPSLTHIALHVEAFDACAAFYREYCGMQIVRERSDVKGRRVLWLAEPGRQRDFIIVLVPGGRVASQASDDYTHLGFALESREAVDAIAARASAAGCLVWPPP